MFDLGPDVSWADQDGWAPHVVSRGGTYYFYYTAGGRIGVATASSPLGPFTDSGGVLLDQAWDPNVFIDDDGQVYFYSDWTGFANKHCLALGKLRADMLGFASGPTCDESLPYFGEGSFTSKRNGIYYLSYSVGAWQGNDYHVDYATSASPTGPWAYRGTILSKNAEDTGPGHHSLFRYPGSDDWYMVYHRWENRNGAADASGYQRRTAIDRMYFNGDGTIQSVVMTNSGVDSRTVAGGHYKLSNRLSGKVLDVPYEGYQNNGAKLQQWADLGYPQQRWQLTDLGNGYYKIINDLSGKALDVPYETYQNDGSRIQQWTYTGDPQQQWKVEDVGGGYCKITNRLSGKVLDVPYESYQSNGTQIQQWSDLATPQQQWTLEVVP